jgi:hypothetical protein
MRCSAAAGTTPACLKEGLGQWAVTGLSVGEIRAWLEADIANPWLAVRFRKPGTGPEELRGSRLDEQVSIGRLSVDNAGRAILGPRAANGLDQLGRRSTASSWPAATRPAAEGRVSSSCPRARRPHRADRVC